MTRCWPLLAWVTELSNALGNSHVFALPMRKVSILKRQGSSSSRFSSDVSTSLKVLDVMRPIGPSRPNKLIAATVFGVLVAIAVSRLVGAQSNEFRFEDYSGSPQYDTELKATEAAKAGLYKLFPKGSGPESLAEFIEGIGGNCKERSEPKYIERYGNALYCRYQHPYAGEPYIGHHWIIYVFREHDINQISKIEIKSRIVAP